MWRGSILRREVKTLLELLLTSQLEDVEIIIDDQVVKVKSRKREAEISVNRNTLIHVSTFLFYLHELTGSIFHKYLASTRRLKELRSYFNVKVDVYIVDCDEDTRVLINLIEVLLRDFKYTLEKAVNVAALLVMISREARVVKRLQTQSVREDSYLEYQESLSRVASCLRQLEVEVQSSDEVVKLLDLANRTQISEEFSRRVIESFLVEEGFTGVYYASRVLGKCSPTIASTVSDLYSSVLSQSGVFVLAPSIMRALLREIVPREELIELP